MIDRFLAITPYLSFIDSDIDLDSLSESEFNKLRKDLYKKSKIKLKSDLARYKQELIKAIIRLEHAEGKEAENLIFKIKRYRDFIKLNGVD